MDSFPIPAPQSASTSADRSSLAEVEAKSEERVKEMVHRTKVIQFLGRKTPIILQNDNGPCPLLAICNVLSLKNSLNLSPDISEVSQEKLLSLVAERLIDSNTNINNKETGYVENQQQNIADAIDLLPRLRTGIDVNVKFRRIDDFEFTPECAIFDLLDIPLYHGWIFDPQDNETADAIGSKSYNTLMGELVSLETKNMQSECKNNLEDDSVDFVAATTATLGVPSPSLSTGQSCDESPQKARKGDIEEETELLRVLKLSEGKVVSLADVNIHENAHIKKSELVTELESLEKRVTDETVKTEWLITSDSNTLNGSHLNLRSSEVFPQIAIDPENKCAQTIGEESSKYGDSIVGSDTGTENVKIQPSSVKQDPPASGNSHDKQRSDENTPNESTTLSDADEQLNNQNACVHRDTSSSVNAVADPHATSEQMHNVHEHEVFSSSVDSSEPIYEGEECILDSGSVTYENREPVYEGEVVLAAQVDTDSMDSIGLSSKAMCVKQGEIIRNFMKNSASQLTVYGLFCLQDKVKEREICVFFRNNHFNTMFKYEGELYILATDQGFINQPDLVWEKLNEVNGDTVYMTSDFKVFKMEDHSNSTWDEHNVLDYLASIDSTQENSSFNSDLQLAIALQQQEFDQQQQVQQVQQQVPQPHMQQPGTSGGSRLVTGPQAPRSRGKHSTTSKNESKSKERCTIM